MGILRSRMEHDLVVRGRSVHTQRAYLRTVGDLARYYRRSPDQLSNAEVQQYLRYLIEERHWAWATRLKQYTRSCESTVTAAGFRSTSAGTRAQSSCTL